MDEAFLDGLEEAGIAHHRGRPHQGVLGGKHLFAIGRQVGLGDAEERAATAEAERRTALLERLKKITEVSDDEV